MGRKSLAATAHPGRQCSQCSYCGRTSEDVKKFVHIIDWKDDVKERFFKEFGLVEDCCLCDPCRLKLQRTLKGETGKTKEKNQHVCYLREHGGCKTENNSRIVETSVEWAQFAATFSLYDIPSEDFPPSLHLCLDHYNRLQAFKKEKCCNCQRLVRGEGRRCPDPKIINDLNHDLGVDLSLTEESIICQSCFNQFRKVIYRHTKLKSVSVTGDLHEIIQNAQSDMTENTDDVTAYATAKAAVFTGEIFLNGKAVLLSQIRIKYEQFLHDACTRCGTPVANIPVKSNQSLMMDLIKTYGHHLVYFTSRRKQHGTMLMRKGSDVTAILHAVLNEQNDHTNQTQSPIETSTRPTPTHEVLSKAAQTINSELRRQGMAFASKAAQGQDFTKLDINDVIKEIEPTIWNFFYLLTETLTEQRERDRRGDFSWDTIYYQELNPLSMRRFYNICHAIYLMNDKSSYPMHLLLADTVQCQGGTQCLLQLLNKLGITSSRTSLDAHKNAAIMMSIQTMREKLATPAFGFASIDNIDKGAPHAVVSADAQPRSVHGTSFQVVFPQPTENVNFGDDYVTCSTSTPPQEAATLKVIKISRDNLNLYKCLAARNSPILRTCERNEDGCPLVTDNKEMEKCLVQLYKQELINGLKDSNEEFMDEVGEYLPQECLDVTQRIEHLNRESTVPAEIEAAAVAVLAKCPVQIYQAGSRFLYKEFGTCYKGVEPLQIMQDATGYDLLMSRDLDGSTADLTGHVLSQNQGQHIFREWRDRNAALLHLDKLSLSVSDVLGECKSGDESKSDDECSPAPKKQKTRVSDITLARTTVGHHYIPSRRRVSPTTHAISDFELQPSEASEERRAKEKLTSFVMNRCSGGSTTLKELFAPSEPPEKSNAVYLGVLNEHADNIEAVLHSLEQLQTKMEVGKRLKHLIVVGDAKTYGHLCKIKQDYVVEMEWLYPFPGDWHILKNLQPVIMKVYWHAGLQDMAKKNHKGATFTSLVMCSHFKRTHRFLMNAWEAIFQRQLCAISTMAGDDNDLSLPRMEEFAAKLGADDEAYRFWWHFTTRDMMSYIMLYVSMRTGNWELRLAALKKMAPLFHAFDRPMYLRLIPGHLHDVLNMPASLLDHLKHGGFTVSMSGRKGQSLGADEAHESLINREVKMALHAPDPHLMDRLALILPYRAMGQQNLKSQLIPSTQHSSNNHDRHSQATVKLYTDILEETVVTTTEPKKTALKTLVTNQPADEVQRKDMGEFYEIGKMDLQSYISTRLLNIPSVAAPRRKRALRTFVPRSLRKTKVNQKEKNKRIVAACLRRQLAHAKRTGEPIQNLGQFIQFPLAIATDDGCMYKGSKSVVTAILQKRYDDVFLPTLPNGWKPDCVVLEGMFLINTGPLACHKTFGDYVVRIINSYLMYHIERGTNEIHVVFDHPDRNGISPKTLEKQRRDNLAEEDDQPYDTIDMDTALPSNWRKFLGNRRCKRLLVNFLTLAIPRLMQPHLSLTQMVVLAGGLDGENCRDSAISCSRESIQTCPQFSSNHEESDSRVWYHACQTKCKRICVYSPDTDVYNIGMSLMSRELKDKDVIVQLSMQKCDHMYCHLNVLKDKLHVDPDLHHIPEGSRLAIMQMLYICSGCDYVSYFAGCGKTTFYSSFFQHAEFVTSGKAVTGRLDDTNPDTSLLSFFRLVGAVYFKRYFSAFKPMKLPFELYKSINEPDIVKRHQRFLDLVREATWEKADYEIGVLPSNDALQLHWKRASWVSLLWSQANRSHVVHPPLEDYGYLLENDKLAVQWDTQENRQSVEMQVDWIMKGCGCGSGCANNRCKCKKSNRSCGPSCTCVNCQNSIRQPNEDKAADVDLQLHQEEIQGLEEINPDNNVETVESGEEVDELSWMEDHEETLEDYMSDENEDDYTL